MVWAYFILHPYLGEKSSHLTKIFSNGLAEFLCLGQIAWRPQSFLSTLPETNSSHLKMDGWNTRFLLGWPIFSGAMLVSGV